MKDTLQEPISERTVDQNDDLPVPQVVGKFHEEIKVTLQGRISERIHEQDFDVPVLQIFEEIVEVLTLFRVNGCNNALPARDRRDGEASFT